MKKSIAIVTATCAALLFASAAWALPHGANVVSGGSNISQPDTNTMRIDQTTAKSIIEWQGYSIGAGETVNYVQPSASAISLNRVVGLDPSAIYGSLNANGRVWVINPNGLLVGNGAKINVGGFLGSTLDIGNADFLGGNYTFSAVGAGAGIENYGDITAAGGGYVVLVSPSITNAGSISAPLGKAYLASGDALTLNFAGDDLVGFTIDAQTAADALGITNAGTISANGGEVILSAESAGELLKSVVNNEGIIEARTIADREGRILLLGGMDDDSITVGGTLDASAPDGGNGGFIETSAAKVTIDDPYVTTMAPEGETGTWLIDPNDFIIAATGGDMTGAQLSANLASTSVDIWAVNGSTPGNGDIFVNDTVSWSANRLRLLAQSGIYINDVMNLTGLAILNVNREPTIGFYKDGTYRGRVNLAGGSSFQLSMFSTEYFTVINDAAGLMSIDSDPTGNYVLGSDITLSGSFEPLCNSGTSFSGMFFGLGHVITGLSVEEGSVDLGTLKDAGLFGGAASQARILYVGLEGVNINASLGRDAGALVANNGGVIIGCYATGSVNAPITGDDQTSLAYYIGGLVGKNNGYIDNSHSSVTVNSQLGTAQMIGGLVGYNWNASLKNSYSTGNVYGPPPNTLTCYIGGLIGFNRDASVDDCYSLGLVMPNGSDNDHFPDPAGGLAGADNGGIRDSYFNIDTAGLTEAVGSGTIATGGGLSSAQMKQQANFIGWDFTKAWGIDEGSSYPYPRSYGTESIASPTQDPPPDPAPGPPPGPLTDLNIFVGDPADFDSGVVYKTILDDTADIIWSLGWPDNPEPIITYDGVMAELDLWLEHEIVFDVSGPGDPEGVAVESVVGDLSWGQGDQAVESVVGDLSPSTLSGFEEKKELPEDPNITYMPDGSVVTTLPDGTKVTETEEGYKITEFADGTVAKEMPRDQVIVELPDGTKTIEYNEGHSIINYPDGTYKVSLKNGTVVEGNKNKEITTFPDGTVVTDYKNGTVITVKPDGAKVTEMTFNKDGRGGIEYTLRETQGEDGAVKQKLVNNGDTSTFDVLGEILFGESKENSKPSEQPSESKPAAPSEPKKEADKPAADNTANNDDDNKVESVAPDIPRFIMYL